MCGKDGWQVRLAPEAVGGDYQDMEQTPPLDQPPDEWKRKVASFQSSRRVEPRLAGQVINAEMGWAEPCAREGERIVLVIYASHWLLEVTDPPGWGFRLVGLVSDGKSLTWDLPGYPQREAEKLAVLLIEDYI